MYYEFILAKFEDVFGGKIKYKIVKVYEKITAINGKP